MSHRLFSQTILSGPNSTFPTSEQPLICMRSTVRKHDTTFVTFAFHLETRQFGSFGSESRAESELSGKGVGPNRGENGRRAPRESRGVGVGAWVYVVVVQTAAS